LKQHVTLMQGGARAEGKPKKAISSKIQPALQVGVVSTGILHSQVAKCKMKSGGKRKKHT
jgi:hypothetical protein